MDKQMALSAFSDELAQVRTKKKEFLEQIERIVPWRLSTEYAGRPLLNGNFAIYAVLP